MNKMKSISYSDLLTHLILLYIVSVNDVFCQNFVYPTDNPRYEGSDCVSSRGVRGICRKLNECDNTQRTISNSDLCTFVHNTPIYCCPNAINQKLDAAGNRPPITNASPSGQLSGSRPIQQICDHYYPKDTIPKVGFAGGIKTLVDEQPHMAAIGWPNFDGGVDWRCGGSIVTSNFILTAAHCASFRGAPPSVARTGDLHLLVEENNTFPEDFRITNTYVHPDYKSDQFYHDIALLKITPDFSNRGLLPACIWPTYEIPKNRFKGMGYGTTEFGGPWSNELFQGFLNHLENEECTNRLPASPDLPKGIIRSQLCAHDPKSITDTCQGDSGGPLQFTETGGIVRRPMIVGITSFGQNCAGSTPGVYTRVSEYIDWIESILMTDFHNKTLGGS